MKNENVKIWVDGDVVWDMVASEPVWSVRGNHADHTAIKLLGYSLVGQGYYIDNDFLEYFDYSKKEVIRIFEKLLFYMRLNNTEDSYTEEDYVTIESIINSIENLL